MKNKRGLSSIVTTLIILVIALVAIGVVYVVISNTLTNKSDEASFRDKCLGSGFRATGLGALCADIISNNCVVTVEKDITSTKTPDRVRVDAWDSTGVKIGTTPVYSAGAIGQFGFSVTFVDVATNPVKKVATTSDYLVNGVYQSCNNAVEADF